MYDLKDSLLSLKNSSPTGRLPCWVPLMSLKLTSGLAMHSEAIESLHGNSNTAWDLGWLCWCLCQLEIPETLLCWLHSPDPNKERRQAIPNLTGFWSSYAEEVARPCRNWSAGIPAPPAHLLCGMHLPNTENGRSGASSTHFSIFKSHWHFF